MHKNTSLKMVGVMFLALFLRMLKKGGQCACIVLPSIVLSGIMLPAEMLPEALQVVGKIFPATWCYKAMCGPVVELGTVWPVLLVTAALIVISMVKLKRLAAD